MSKEKGVLPGVFSSSIVAALATALVCPPAKSSIFIRCCLSSCVANASVCLAFRESIIQRFNFLRRTFLLSNISRRYLLRHKVGVRPSQLKSKKNCRGMTLIEVLVTLVLLSVGLLGLAAMQVRAMQMNQGAYMRSQAVSLSQDMADRMRINWKAAKKGKYDLALPADSDDFADTAGDSDQLKLAKKDIRDWLKFIKANLPTGDGSISRTDDRFTITVCWDDNRDPGKADPKTPCGTDGLELNVLEVTL